MKLSSQSIENAQRIPEKFAAGVPGDGGPKPGPNHSPELTWTDAPAGTRSFAVICHDPDVPSRPDDVNQPGRVVPYDLPRSVFYHWVLVDIPAARTELAAGIDSDAFVPRGKSFGQTPHGVRGINSYADWFASDPNMTGDWGGYDGPWPPFNDERLHHYTFTVYALDVPSLDLPERFTGPDALSRMEGHILAQASITGTYSLYPNPR